MQHTCSAAAHAPCKLAWPPRSVSCCWSPTSLLPLPRIYAAAIWLRCQTAPQMPRRRTRGCVILVRTRMQHASSTVRRKRCIVGAQCLRGRRGCMCLMLRHCRIGCKPWQSMKMARHRHDRQIAQAAAQAVQSRQTRSTLQVGGTTKKTVQQQAAQRLQHPQRSLHTLCRRSSRAAKVCGAVT